MATEKETAAIDAAHELVGRFDETDCSALEPGERRELERAAEVLRAALIAVYEEREATAARVLREPPQAAPLRRGKR